VVQKDEGISIINSRNMRNQDALKAIAKIQIRAPEINVNGWKEEGLVAQKVK